LGVHRLAATLGFGLSVLNLRFWSTRGPKARQPSISPLDQPPAAITQERTWLILLWPASPDPVRQTPYLPGDPNKTFIKEGWVTAWFRGVGLWRSSFPAWPPRACLTRPGLSRAGI